MTKKYKIIIISLVCIVLLLSGFLIFRSCNSPGNNTLPLDDSASKWSGSQQLPSKQATTKSICVPGFDSLVFIAGQKKQAVNFYNPSVNGDRLFKMSLMVDGKEYWQSGYCGAGNGYYHIELTEPLEIGEYSACLNVRCFKPDGTEINGAKVDFKLYVQEEETT